MNITATINTNHKSAVVLLSKKGMKELKKSIAQLEQDRQTAIRTLRELNKTSHHDDRLARVERLAELDAIESELSEKKQILSSARLIPSRRARLKVAIGSVVDLIDQQGRLFRYTLVESIEANPSDGRISVASPLGQRLVGKTVKDIVQWTNHFGTQSLQLVRIT